MDAAAVVAADAETAEDRLGRDPPFDAVDAEPRAVAPRRVNPSVRATYERKNAKFILWLFDRRERYCGLLQPALLDELAPQQARDEARRTQADEPSKKRDGVRATCRRWLGGIERSRPETHPIRLADLDMTVYGRYLDEFKKRAPNRSNGGAKAEIATTCLSQSAYDLATSALTHLYTECGLDKTKISEELWNDLKEYKRGIKRNAAKEKKKLSIRTAEGKKRILERERESSPCVMGRCKDVQDFSTVEVGVWLAAQGLGEHAPKFLREGVTGDLLSSLTVDDLKSDLDLSGLHAKKVVANLKFTRDLGAGALKEKIGALSKENEGLSEKVAALEHKLKAPDFGDRSWSSVMADEEEEDVEGELGELEPMCPRKRARDVEQRTQEQLANRKIKVGFHHGHYNPLPASWKMPKRLTVIQLANLWLVGCEQEHVPPLRKLSTIHLNHIDPESKSRSKMKTVMSEIEYFAKLEHVWLDRGCWNEAAVTKMWSAVWPHLDPYLRKESGHKEMTVEKRRQGQMPWRTCYNKLNKMGCKGRLSKLCAGREGGGGVGVGGGKSGSATQSSPPRAAGIGDHHGDTSRSKGTNGNGDNGNRLPRPEIRTPHPHDVLCGRGSRGTIHPGNVRFQALVDGHHSEYLPWIQTSLKTHIAAQIVAHIQGLDPPGRFLQRENARTGTWVEMGNDLARRKTSQALRESAPELRQGVSFRPAGEKRKSTWQAADLPPPQIRKERGEESKGCPNAECKADNTNGAIWL